MLGERGPTISKITLENFCGFRKYELDLMPLTVLVGPNNGGKTTVLRAIRLIIDFMELVLPDYSARVVKLSEDLTKAERGHAANLAKLQEDKNSAVRSLAENQDLDKPSVDRKKVEIISEYETKKGKAKRAFEQQLQKMESKRPVCEWRMSPS